LRNSDYALNHVRFRAALHSMRCGEEIKGEP
jgi:hypothetical protein